MNKVKQGREVWRMVLAGLFLLAVVGCDRPAAPQVGEADTSDESTLAVVRPRFPGCEERSLPNEEARFRCAMNQLLDYLSRDLTYPEEAKRKGTSGEAIIHFDVHEDGRVSFVKIVEDPGDGLGEEAARLVRKMEADGIRWRPGMKEGKPAKFPFYFPVAFNLPRDPDTGTIPGQ